MSVATTLTAEESAARLALIRARHKVWKQREKEVESMLARIGGGAGEAFDVNELPDADE